MLCHLADQANEKFCNIVPGAMIRGMVAKHSVAHPIRVLLLCIFGPCYSKQDPVFQRCIRPPKAEGIVPYLYCNDMLACNVLIALVHSVVKPAAAFCCEIAAPIQLPVCRRH